MPTFQVIISPMNVKKIEIYKRIREIQIQEDYELLQDELIDRFGEYPDVVAYLLEIGFIKSYLDQVFVKVVDRKDNQLTVKFEPITKQLFLTQDYFAALSATNLKARIAESQGLIELIFDVRNKKRLRNFRRLATIWGKITGHQAGKNGKTRLERKILLGSF